MNKFILYYYFNVNLPDSSQAVTDNKIISDLFASQSYLKLKFKLDLFKYPFNYLSPSSHISNTYFYFIFKYLNYLLFEPTQPYIYFHE